MWNQATGKRSRISLRYVVIFEVGRQFEIRFQSTSGFMVTALSYIETTDLLYNIRLSIDDPQRLLEHYVKLYLYIVIWAIFYLFRQEFVATILDVHASLTALARGQPLTTNWK